MSGWELALIAGFFPQDLHQEVSRSQQRGWVAVGMAGIGKAVPEDVLVVLQSPGNSLVLAKEAVGVGFRKFFAPRKD